MVLKPWRRLPRSPAHRNDGEVGEQLFSMKSQPKLTWHLLKSSPQGRRAHPCWSSQTSPAQAARWCGKRCWVPPGPGNSLPRRPTSGGAGWWRPRLWVCDLVNKEQEEGMWDSGETFTGHPWQVGGTEVWIDCIINATLPFLCEVTNEKWLPKLCKWTARIRWVPLLQHWMKALSKRVRARLSGHEQLTS